MTELYLWKHLPKDKELFVKEKQCSVENLRILENIERIFMNVHPNSSFDCIVSGCMPPQTVIHDSKLLSRIVQLAQPKASVTIVETVKTNNNNMDQNLKTLQELVKNLKLAGMTNLEEPKLFETQLKNEIKEVLNIKGEFEVYSIKCTMPDYEFGSSRLLSFAKKTTTPKTNSETSKIWSIADVDDDDVDLVNSDDLLDEEDLNKPDPSTLRVCATTGKRKACKDCSCGLKEELEGEKKPQKKDMTSSCGSCYLGDAFRCASCPYLGMPAFKPGEKIQLSNRQLNPDA